MTEDFEAELLTATGDADRWPALLERFAAQQGAIGAAIVPGLDPSMMRFTPSIRAGFQSYIDDGIYLDDKRVALMPKLADNKVLDDLDAYSPSQIARMEYYQEWLPAQGMGAFAAVRGGAADAPVVVALYRARGEPGFTADAMKAMEPISDALMRAVAIDRAVGAHMLVDRTRWHEATGTGVIGLDRVGRVTFVSDEARRLLGPALRVRHGRMLFALASAERRFGHALRQSDAIVHAAALGLPHDRVLPDAVYVPRPIAHAAPAQGLMLQVHPITEGYRGFVAAAHLLVLSDPFRPSQIDDAVFETLWSLTPREAELVKRLVDAQVLAEAADAMGITSETARSYLKTIYRKSGTRAQSELVARAARLRMPAG